MFLGENFWSKTRRVSMDSLKWGGSTTLPARKGEANSSAFGTTDLIPENKSLSSASEQADCICGLTSVDNAFQLCIRTTVVHFRLKHLGLCLGARRCVIQRNFLIAD